MKKNDENINSNKNNQEISKQIENSLEILILYRSLYIIKEKFILYKERIRKIYDKYNIYKNNYKLKEDIKIYQINKKDFVQVTDEVLKDLNLLIIKYINPKDIFLSKVLIEQKSKETIPLIQEILNWLEKNNNGKFSIKKYNKIFFNKKIKPYIENIQELGIINTESNIEEKRKETENDDVYQNFAKKTHIRVVEYNRRGLIVNCYKSQILEDENTESGEAVIETIDSNKINTIPAQKDSNMLTNKELSIKINNIDESNNLNKSNIVITNDFLFIESLPLILADYLEAHLNNAVIDTEDELAKELRTLFDNELLKKINDFSNALRDKSTLLSNLGDISLSKDEKQKKELENALENLKKIKDNIKLYRNILESKKKTNDDYGYIEKMIEKLMAKQIWLEHRIKLLYEKEKNNINSNSTNNLNITNNIGMVTGISEITPFGNYETNKNLSNINNNKSQIYNTSMNRQLNESITNSLNTGLLNDKSNTSIISNSSKSKIINALQDIFIYYTKQHIIVGYTPLFSNIEKKKLHLDLNEFSKFCIDFRIPIIRQKIVEIFKKNTSDFHHMTFKEFKNAINSLANETHESKKKTLTEKINTKKNELNTIELKEKRIKEEKKLQRILNYNNDENINYNTENSNQKKKKAQNINRSPSAKVNLVLQKKNIFNDISENKIQYNNENKKSYQEIVEDFYEFLGLYSAQEYHSKMRGYNMSPVKTVSNVNHDKSFLSGDGNRSKSLKNEEVEEVNKIVKNNRDERIRKQLKEKEKMKKLIYKEKLKLFNINNQRLKLTIDKKMKKKTYLDLMKEQQEEKSELLLMQKNQENFLKNKLKEKELIKTQKKERLKELKKINSISKINSLNYKKEESKDSENKSKEISIIEDKNLNYINNNFNTDINNKKNYNLINKNIEKGIPINDIKINKEITKKEEEEKEEEKEEEEKRRNDKNQIWWEKLENYDINDLGMNEEEKDIFVNSDFSEDNDISKISKAKVNSHNNSFGGLISENSLQKSSSIPDLNKEKNNNVIKLPPIITNKSTLKKGNNKIIELNPYDDYKIKKIRNSSMDQKKSQNQKKKGIDEIKNRIFNGNLNSKENSNRYRNIYKNNSAGLIKTTPNTKNEKY